MSFPHSLCGNLLVFMQQIGELTVHIIFIIEQNNFASFLNENLKDDER